MDILYQYVRSGKFEISKVYFKGGECSRFVSFSFYVDLPFSYVIESLGSLAE